MDKGGVKQFLGLKFLTDADAGKNWRFIVMAILMSLFMVRFSHVTDQKVMKVSALNVEIKKLKTLYVETSTQLSSLKMESAVLNKMRVKGFEEPRLAPIEIKTIDIK